MMNTDLFNALSPAVRSVEIEICIICKKEKLKLIRDVGKIIDIYKIIQEVLGQILVGHRS